MIEIYVDLDGVLVDIDSGVAEVHGPNWDALYKKDRDGFWEPINKIGIEFWRRLKWIDGSRELWELVAQHAVILAARSRHRSSRLGKFIWVYENMGSEAASKAIICFRREKVNFAAEGCLLIDDYHKNIKLWQDKGGMGVLFKTPEQAVDEVKHFKKLRGLSGARIYKL